MDQYSNVVYLVKVNQMDDDMIATLLEFGTVEEVSKLINVYGVTTFPANKDELLKVPGVIKVEENSVGYFA